MKGEAVPEENLLCVPIQKGVTFSPPVLWMNTRSLPCYMQHLDCVLTAEFVGFYPTSDFDLDFSRCVLWLCKCTISDAQAF